ncbi:MAG: hypothetical protein LWY06_15360 [Firmicutes bacterium]|nr:hypothetical protein [Bacillota bacterium]
MRFILKSGKLERFSYSSRFELQKDILKNAEVFLGENAIILDIRKLEQLGIRHEYMPDAFLLDFSKSDIPELHLMFFDAASHNFHQTLVPRIVGSLLLLRQNQGRHFADDLTALLLHDPDLLKVFFKGNVRNILETVRSMVKNCSKILAITDGNEYEMQRIKEMYGDSWGRKVSHHVVGKILLEGEPVYIVNPDFRFRNTDSESDVPVDFEVDEVPFTSETEEITVDFNLIDSSETQEHRLVDIPVYADEMEELPRVRKQSVVKAEVKAIPEPAKEVQKPVTATSKVKKEVPASLRPTRENASSFKAVEAPVVEEVEEAAFESIPEEPVVEAMPEYEEEGFGDVSEGAEEENGIDASDFKEEISDEIEMEEEFAQPEPEEEPVMEMEEEEPQTEEPAEEEPVMEEEQQEEYDMESFEEPAQEEEETMVQDEEPEEEIPIEEEAAEEESEAAEEEFYEESSDEEEEIQSEEETLEEEAEESEEESMEEEAPAEEFEEEIQEEEEEEEPAEEPAEEAEEEVQPEEHEEEEEIDTGEVKWRSFTPLSLIKTQTVRKLLEPTLEKTIVRIKGDKIGMVVPVGRDVFVQGLKYALTYGDVLTPFSGKRRSAEDMQEALNSGEHKILEGILAVGSETETKIVINNVTDLDPVTAEEIIKKIVLPGILRGSLLNQVPDVIHAKYDANPDYFIKYFSFFDKEAVEYTDNFMI